MKKALPAHFAVVALLCCCFAALAAGQSQCQNTINGLKYDLSPLSSYQQSTTWASFVVTYTPCMPTTCQTYQGVALCQRVSGSTSGGWPLGDYATARWSASPRPGNEKGFRIVFTSSAGAGAPATTTIDFICDPNFSSVGNMVPGPNGAEPSFNNFFFDWKSVYACPVKSSGGGGGDSGGGGSDDDGGLAGGWIFIIVLFSVTIVYFAAGFAFNKWYRKEEGIQNQIPQYDFWVSLPGLVKDGCVYSYRKTMSLVGRGNNPEYLG